MTETIFILLVTVILQGSGGTPVPYLVTEVHVAHGTKEACKLIKKAYRVHRVYRVNYAEVDETVTLSPAEFYCPDK